VALHGVDGEVEQRADLGQRLVEHVLHNHDAALEDRKLRKARHRGLDRFLAHQHLHGIRGGLVGDVVGRLNRLSRADRPASQQVQRTVVRDPEQPRSKRRRLVQLVQGEEGPHKRILHDVLAVDDRSHQPRAVAVQLGPQLAGQGEEPSPAVAVHGGGSSGRERVHVR
jgi:hypothetical protein